MQPRRGMGRTDSTKTSTRSDRTGVEQLSKNSVIKGTGQGALLDLVGLDVPSSKGTREAGSKPYGLWRKKRVTWQVREWRA